MIDCLESEQMEDWFSYEYEESMCQNGIVNLSGKQNVRELGSA
jgi:hypothetical protein